MFKFLQIVNNYSAIRFIRSPFSVFFANREKDFFLNFLILYHLRKKMLLPVLLIYNLKRETIKAFYKTGARTFFRAQYYSLCAQVEYTMKLIVELLLVHVVTFVETFPTT